LVPGASISQPVSRGDAEALKPYGLLVVGDRRSRIDEWPLGSVTADESEAFCRAFGFADALLQDDAERRDDGANENTDQGAES
jgi:hypothetical protein